MTLQTDTTKAPDAKFTLSDLGRAEWFGDDARASMWVRAYSCIHIPHDRFLEALDGAKTDLILDEPVSIAYGVVDGLEVPTSRFTVRSAESGQTILRADIRPLKLDLSTYVFFATPYKRNGSSRAEIDCKRTIGRAAALIVGHVGQNMLRELVFECEVECVGGKMHVPGSFVRVPQAAEGPFLGSGLWNDIAETTEALIQCPPQVRMRIELALEYFERAIWENDSFFLYWTALEVLCSGKAQKIRQCLARVYETKNLTGLDRETGFGVIAKWRHDLCHKGQRINTSADVERLIQMLFLDLLRDAVNLPPRRLLAAIVNAGAFDLSPLGLTNRRKGTGECKSDEASDDK